MYYTEDKILQKLNISKSELNVMKLTDSIIYSKKTDKYDIDSCLETRTMTIGLENIIDEDTKKMLIDKMGRQSSFYRYLFSQFQKNDGVTISANEASKLGQKAPWELMSYEALSAHAYANGQYKSMKTWFSKTIEEIEAKIEKLNNILENKILTSRKIRFIQRKIKRLENKLEEHQSRGYLKTWFGRKNINDKEKYRKSRLSLKIQGEETKQGNRNIRIQKSKKSDSLELKIYNTRIQNIKIPNSHKETFSLDHFNRQSCIVSYNSKGNLVLNITYSYIKPQLRSKTEKSKGMIGIDIGPKEIAVAFVKNDGNPLFYRHYPIGNLLDKSNKSTNLGLSLILDKIIEEGERNNIFKITIENLDFKDNFDMMRSKKLNRMLKAFPYDKFEKLIESKCHRRGFDLKKINPAYTSIQGIFKYSNRDNLSTNHNSKSKDLSAALVIARRGLGFHEKAIVSIRVFGKLISIPIKSLVDESEKDSTKFNMKLKKSNSNWSLWSRLYQNYKTLDELTAHVLANPKSINIHSKFDVVSLRKRTSEVKSLRSSRF